MIYVDTSALVKLIWQEDESDALQRWLDERAEGSLVSSALLAIEVRRTVLRERPDWLLRADLLLTRVVQVSITDPVVESASRLPDPGLRSLDAIHLATALLLREELTDLLTYDKRLAAAAAAHGLSVAVPA